MKNLTNNLVAFFATLFLATALSAQIPTANLVAHFPLDGNGNEIVGGLTPISTYGSPAAGPDRLGNPGKSVYFDGGSFYSYGDVLDMDSADFSMSVWVNMTSYTNPSTFGANCPFVKGGTIYSDPDYTGYVLGLRDVSVDPLGVTMTIGDKDEIIYQCHGNYVFGQWHHIVMSRCDTIIKLHIDGVLVGQNIIPEDVCIDTEMYLSIGANDRTSGLPNTAFFNGYIDDLRMYKGRCLSDAEIDQLICPTPDGMASITPTPTSVMLNWNAAEGALGYQLQGGEVGGPTGTIKTLNTSKAINILSPGTTYQWRIQSYCSPELSSYSAYQTFTTPTLRETGSFKLYPNPSNGETVTLDLNGQQAQSLQVVSIDGRILREQEITTHDRTISLSDPPKGVYFIRLFNQEGMKQEIMVVE